MKTSLAKLSLFFGFAFLFSACASFSGAPVEEPVEVQAQAEVVASPLEVWLAEAPKPEKVACSVTESTAPTAVEEFNTLSERIYTLYQQVYDDAQTASTHEEVAPAALDMATEEGRTVWRTQAQAAITANYQSAVQAIEAQKKDLAVYTENLRSDASITNIENRVQQQMAIGQICKDSLRLGEQLTSAGKGASLILQQRIETTLEK